MSTGCLTGRICGSENQGVEAGVVPSTIIPGVSFGEFVLPGPATWGSVVLQVLVPQKGLLPPEDTARVSLNSKLQFPPGPCRLLSPRA